MQKLKPLFLLAFFLGSWSAQAQIATYSFTDLVLDNNTWDNILNVKGKDILEQINLPNTNFTVTHTFATHSTADVKGVHITPVPRTCNEYYILYTLPIAINTTVANTYDGYEIGAVKVTVDANLNPTYSSVPPIIIPEDVNVVTQNIQAALSPESNGTRTYYVGFRRSTSPTMDNYQIAEISVSDQGLSLNGGFYARSQHTVLETHTLEMSPNGRYLAWVGTPNGTTSPQLMIKDVWTSVTNSVSVAGLGIETDVEFDETNKRIYITSQQGIQIMDVATLGIINTIPGTSSLLYYGGDIEQENSTKFYVSKSNGSVAEIYNQVLINPNYVSNGVYHLLEQIDGEPIQHYQSDIPQVSIGIQGDWLVSNVTGGSGQYSYQWNQLGDYNYNLNDRFKPCGRYTHTLWVTDMVTGCKTSASIHYASRYACKKPLPIESEFRQTISVHSNNTIVKVYPNPASKTAQVQVPAQEQLMDLTILDLQGKAVLSLKGNQRATQSIEVASLPKGLYILQIKTNHTTTQKRLAVK